MHSIIKSIQSSGFNFTIYNGRNSRSIRKNICHGLTDSQTLIYRLFDYLTVFVLGMTYALVKQQKLNTQNSQINSNKNSQKKTKKTKVKAKQQDKQNSVQSLNQKIIKLTKLKQNIGFTRRVMRWGGIIKHVLLLKILLETQFSVDLNINNLLNIVYAVAIMMFLVLDQFVLYYTIQQNQSLKNRYGRMPQHLLGAIKYFLVLYQQYDSIIEISILLLCIQNALDFIMYAVGYYKNGWYRIVGGLGIITSIISLHKNY